MNPKIIALKIIPAACLLSLAGCQTLSPTHAEVSQASLAMQYLRQDVERLKARGEEDHAHRQNLEARMEQRHRQQVQQQQETQQALVGLRREVEQLRAERERLREEIVADLSERMSRLLAAQTQARTPPRPGAQTGFEHVVAAGQTLSEIARAYGVTIDAILKANNIQDAHRIRQGQTLFIPE